MHFLNNFVRVVCVCLSLFAMTCLSDMNMDDNLFQMINIDINGDECGLADGLYFIGIDISGMSIVDVSNVLEADGGKSIDLVILDKSELRDVDAESIELYMIHHEINKKMIMVNIINNEEKISSDLCNNLCQSPAEVYCGGPCCTNTICKVCLWTTGCAQALDEIDDDDDDYVLSRYLFVAVNCVDGKMNVISDDDDKKEKQFVIIDHGAQMRQGTFDDSGSISLLLLSLLFVGVFLAMILGLILYKKCIKNQRDNQYKTIE